MKSKTKYRLTREQIADLARSAFGEDCRVQEITECRGGMFSAIYRMRRLPEGDEIVLKVGVAPGAPLLTYERDVMPTEVTCLRMIGEQTAVPVPRVLAHDFTKRRIPSNYFFMTALEGVPLSGVSKQMPPEELRRVKADLGGYLAEIHRIKGPYYGYFTDDPAGQYHSWKTAFTHMFAQLLDDGRARRIRLPYARIERAVERNADLLKGLTAPALVNYDCHEGNVLVRQAGGHWQITGILDLERAFWGDPIADFPAAFIFTEDIRQEPDFLNGYLRAAGTQRAYGEKDARRYQLYRLYILTVMAVEIFRYDFLYGRLQGAWAGLQIARCLRALER